MKNVEILSKGKNFTAIDIGDFSKLAEYSYSHPKLGQEIRGKLFTGETLDSTGAELSFQVLPVGAEIPFLHRHNNHEEIYIVVRGIGEFQVDEKLFAVHEGSVVRVSPDGKRTWRNTGDVSMVLIVIQATVDTLESHYVFDGNGVSGNILWKR